jgi:excisionase family DNA binding protein
MKTERPPVRSRLLPARRAAEYVGVSYGCLRDLANKGQLPLVKFGGEKWARWFFRREDLDALIERHTERRLA